MVSNKDTSLSSVLLGFWTTLGFLNCFFFLIISRKIHLAAMNTLSDILFIYFGKLHNPFLSW